MESTIELRAILRALFATPEHAPPPGLSRLSSPLNDAHPDKLARLSRLRYRPIVAGDRGTGFYCPCSCGPHPNP